MPQSKVNEHFDLLQMVDIGEVEVGVVEVEVEVAEVMVGGVEGWVAVRFRGLLKSKHNFQ